MNQWQPRYDPAAHQRRLDDGIPPQGYPPHPQQWQPQQRDPRDGPRQHPPPQPWPPRQQHQQPPPGYYPPQQQRATVTVTRKPITFFEHLVHLLLTFCTLGLWIPMWIARAAAGRKERSTTY